MKVLTGASLESLCLGTRLDYALVGVRAHLLEEAGQGVRLGSGKGGPDGSFMDLLRLKNGSRDHRGLVIAATAKEPRVPGDAAAHRQSSTVRRAISSSATGSGRATSLCCWTGRRRGFREAATQINRDYSQRTG